MNQLWKRGLAAAVTGAMLVSCLTGCSASQDDTTEALETVQQEADKVTEAAVSLLGSHGAEAGKEETVYVVADAAGQPTQTIVSAWLKNPEEADTIVDSADLQDIQNVKGDETYTVDSQGNLTWAAHGNDIYYQGTTEKALPVTTAISYELDGKSVTAEELAGASGHLVITFSYTNNTATQREVNGETVTLYQPFVVVSGLMLDNDKASAVEVTNGKTINSGEQTIVVGMALPGLKESLGLDDLTDEDGQPVDIDIPETVVIEADVQDFSLLTTVTVMDNSLLSDLDLDDVETLDELQDAMDELTDASSQLVEGTQDLYDGVSQLSDGTAELTDGINTLDSGAGQLNDGAATLNTGAAQLSDGAATLYAGTGLLATGAYTVSQSMDTLYAGLVSIGDGAKQVDDGLAQMQEQVASLPEGTAALYSGALLVKAALKGDQGQSIYEGAGQLAAGAGAIAQGLESGNWEEPGIYEAAQQLQSGADSIASGASDIGSAAYQVQQGLAGLPSAVSEAAGGLSAADSYADSALNSLYSALASIDGEEDPDAYNAVYSAISSVTASQQYVEGVAGALSQVSTDMSQADYALTAIQNGADAIESGANSLSAGAEQVAAGAETLYAGANALADGAGAIQSGINTLIEGNNGNNLNALISGIATLSDSSQALVDGVSQLKAGQDALTEGTDAAVAGAGQLADGSQTLADSTAQLRSGASDLADGAKTLADGADSLASGTATLKQGTADLKDGGVTLSDGVSQLLSGASDLMDGMAEFDEEGIQALSSVLEDDAQGFLDRLRAVQILGQEYTSFTGGMGESDSSVWFILRTDSIG